MTFSLADRNHHARQARLIKEQDERYARGEPISGELAHRMTKPKKAEPCHQVFVDIRGENGSRAASPKFFGEAGLEAASRILAALNANITLGRLKGWGNARVETAVHIPAN